MTPSEQSYLGRKLDTPHRDGCFTEHDEDGIRFVVYDGMEWGRSMNGSRRGSTSWWRFRCNDPDCPAILLIRWDKIAAFVNGASPHFYEDSRS